MYIFLHILQAQWISIAINLSAFSSYSFSSFSCNILLFFFLLILLSYRVPLMQPLEYYNQKPLRLILCSPLSSALSCCFYSPSSFCCAILSWSFDLMSLEYYEYDSKSLLLFLFFFSSSFFSSLLPCKTDMEQP